jgi:hypothetical protein
MGGARRRRWDGGNDFGYSLDFFKGWGMIIIID